VPQLMPCGALVAMLFAVGASAVQAQSVATNAPSPRLFVGEIKSDEGTIGERYRLLFVEELLKLKSVSVVTRREDATVVLEGAGQSFTDAKANLSISITDAASGRVLFASSKSAAPRFMWDPSSGATQKVVRGIVGDIKKRFNWK
jgi:hypothetical protein